MSARYPGDTNDALSMLDGTPWWESPDIGVGSLAGGVANEGPNTVYVRVRTNGESFSPATARCQVWVGNPSLVMTPTGGNTVAVGTVLVTQSEFSSNGNIVTKTLPWTASGDASSPDGPGHRCLIARVFPFGTAVPADFDVPNADDQHEAQRNIAIVAVDSASPPGAGAGAGMAGAKGGEPMGPGEDGMWEFFIDTTVPLSLKPAPVFIGTGPPSKVPDALTRTIVKTFGRQFGGFAKPTENVRLDFDLPQERLPRSPDGRPWWPEAGAPKFDREKMRTEIEVKLQAERIARFALKIDLGDVKRGQARVLNVEQVERVARPRRVTHRQGGLTVVFVRVG